MVRASSKSTSRFSTCRCIRLPDLTWVVPAKRLPRWAIADATLSTVLREQQSRLRSGFLVVVGPEGGVAGDEEDAFVDAGAVGVRFSRFVLRTETAALVALSVVQAGLGEA